jgi:hypothetical protein
MSDEVVLFVVGGVSYNIRRRDIDRYPGSFLAAVVKAEWYHGRKPIHINRNGELFKHISAYFVSGNLSTRVSLPYNPALLDNIRKEAEYFGFPELVAECMPPRERRQCRHRYGDS